MKKLIMLLLGVTIIFTFYRCGVTQVSKEITSGPIPTKEQINQDFTAEQLAEGKVIWEKNCSECHGERPPENYTQQKWNNILRRMIGKADLNHDDGTKVYAWIMANAKD